VERACEPSVILWENMGYTKMDRYIRKGFSACVAFLLILFTLFFIIWAKDKDKEI